MHSSHARISHFPDSAILPFCFRTKMACKMAPKWHRFSPKPPPVSRPLSSAAFRTVPYHHLWNSPENRRSAENEHPFKGRASTLAPLCSLRVRRFSTPIILCTNIPHREPVHTFLSGQMHACKNINQTRTPTTRIKITTQAGGTIAI
jgi:hypothetical protein